jgi:hypothetical protein
MSHSSSPSRIRDSLGRLFSWSPNTRLVPIDEGYKSKDPASVHYPPDDLQDDHPVGLISLKTHLPTYPSVLHLHPSHVIPLSIPLLPLLLSLHRPYLPLPPASTLKSGPVAKRSSCCYYRTYRRSLSHPFLNVQRKLTRKLPPSSPVRRLAGAEAEAYGYRGRRFFGRTGDTGCVKIRRSTQEPHAQWHRRRQVRIGRVQLPLYKIG